MIEVDSLLMHMNEWEVHSLRGTVTAMVVHVQVFARRHPEVLGAAELAAELVEMKNKQFDNQLREMGAEVLRDNQRRVVEASRTH